MEIKRDSYLEQLKIRKDNGMIKIITGIRRCGKSFLLFVLFKKYLLESGVDHDHIIEIALDGIENEELRDPKKCYRYIKDAMKDEQKYYLLLDEVQFMPRFEEVLNSLLRIGNIDVYVTGSNSKMLSSDILTQFRDRGDEIRVYPLSFAEFYNEYEGDKRGAWQDYYTYGGMPLATSLESHEEKSRYLKDLFDRTYIKDVLERHEIKNDTEVLDILLDVLASGIGSLTNPSKLANTFKSERQIGIGSETIEKYIGYFEESFLIEKAVRYDVKGRKYIGTPAKYYYTDLGLRNARLGFRQLEETHIMENVLYNDLIRRGMNVDVGVVEYNTKDADGKKIRKQLEVDFVVNQGGKRFYIQSALSIADPDKKEQEIESLKRIPDSFSKMVVVRDYLKPWQDENGITYVGIEQFLLNEELLK